MRRHLSYVAVFLCAAVTALAAQRAEADSHVEVGLDRARLLVLESPASDIIIGNPAYADVTLQSPRRLILFGKKLGQTNIIILDSNRREIMSRNLVVVPGTDVRIRAPGGGAQYYTCGNSRCTLAGVGAAGGGFASPQDETVLPGDEPAATDEEAPVGEATEEVIE